LSSTGERVALAAPLEPELDGTINFAFVDEVAYSYLPPWPSVAENGLALVRIDPARYANDVANWQAAPALQTITSRRVADTADIGNVEMTNDATALVDPGGALAAHNLYLPVVNSYRCPFQLP
jgi:hypothetical protein